MSVSTIVHRAKVAVLIELLRNAHKTTAKSGVLARYVLLYLAFLRDTPYAKLESRIRSSTYHLLASRSVATRLEYLLQNTWDKTPLGTLAMGLDTPEWRAWSGEAYNRVILTRTRIPHIRPNKEARV